MDYAKTSSRVAQIMGSVTVRCTNLRWTSPTHAASFVVSRIFEDQPCRYEWNEWLLLDSLTTPGKSAVSVAPCHAPYYRDYDEPNLLIGAITARREADIDNATSVFDHQVLYGIPPGGEIRLS